MADVLVFHHAQGLTPGVEHFAERLRSEGHEVTVPDLYEGRTFDTVEAGVAHAREIGFETIAHRGSEASDRRPSANVYAGFSLGVMSAQMLAQTRPGARGALLYHACFPVSEFAATWPAGIAVQVHGMERDPFFATEDLHAARELVGTADDAELFLYPGDRHLFADDSLASYDEGAASLLVTRSLAFLRRVGSDPASG